MLRMKDLLFCLSLKTLNLEISCCHLADYFYVKDLCGPHVQHDYFSSLNQSNNRFVSLQLPPSLLKFLSALPCAELPEI